MVHILLIYRDSGSAISLIKPFAGLRPVAGRAADVAAPPYDVLNAAEARQRSAGKPWSFLHISRTEIDLPDNVDAYDPSVYAKGRENLDRMIAEGVLVRDETACYYAYRLTLGQHVQTGLVAGGSVEAYDQGRIKKHEFTRPVKEDDRVRQIDALNAQTGPVFLVYPANAKVDDILREVTVSPAEVDVTAERDGATPRPAFCRCRSNRNRGHLARPFFFGVKRTCRADYSLARLRRQQRGVEKNSRAVVQ